MAGEVDDIRARVDIVSLVGQRVLLKKAGKDWKGPCPFHEDRNPSFNVSPHLGRYKCWSCGESGDVFTWVMKTQNVDFPEALEILAKQAGITLDKKGRKRDKSEFALQQAAMEEALAFFRDQLTKSAAARSYLEGRGIEPATVSLWELGYAPEVGDALAAHLKRKSFGLAMCRSLFLVEEDSSGGYYDKFRGRLIFPIRDEKGDLVAFGGRIIGDGQPKYINSSDTPLYKKSRVLYGMNVAKERIGKERKAVLVEGYLDVIACQRASVPNAIASLGTALSEEHAKLLKRWCDGVVILYDSDAAGQKAADRAIEILTLEGLKVRVALMPQGQDPDTLLRDQGEAAVQKAVAAGLKPMEYRLQALEARLAPAEEEFWPALVEILAAAPTELELVKHLERYASVYPGLKDRLGAQKALRAEVMKYKRTARQPETAAPSRAAAIKTPGVLGLSGSEVCVLGAFLDAATRGTSWHICKESDLFTTDVGAEMARSLSLAFPEAAPGGPPSEWLPQVEPETVRERFADLLYDSRVAQITDRYLNDAILRLRRGLEQRNLDRLKDGEMDDAKRTELLDRLKKLKSRAEG